MSGELHSGTPACLPNVETKHPLKIPHKYQYVTARACKSRLKDVQCRSNFRFQHLKVFPFQGASHQDGSKCCSQLKVRTETTKNVDLIMRIRQNDFCNSWWADTQSFIRQNKHPTQFLFSRFLQVSSFWLKSVSSSQFSRLNYTGVSTSPIPSQNRQILSKFPFRHWKPHIVGVWPFDGILATSKG